MSDSKHELTPLADSEASYPSWEERPRDRSRRRFLTQVSSIAGGAGLLSSIGLAELAHGQSRPVDFSMLDHHASPAALVPSAPSAAAPAREQAREERAEDEPGLASAEPVPNERSDTSEPLAEPSEPSADPRGPEITENRALWVEPGYLILVRITRLESSSDAITAFEGSTEPMSEYLTREIGDTSHLHNVDLLHNHEVALADIVQELISPAILEVLHIDHDCTTVCSALDSGFPPDRIPLRGEPMPVDWE